MLTDTHVHFDGLMAKGDTIPAIVERAFARGVERMVAVGGAAAANRTALEIARAYPGRIRAAVGYNRQVGAIGANWPLASRRGDRATAAGRQTTDDGQRTPLRDQATPERYAQARAAAAGQAADELETILRAPEVAAIGEIGLDFHHGMETAAPQIALFRQMLALARDRRLPVCVHTRAAESETLAALREHAAAWRADPDRIGVMHCYTGGEAFARDLLALGFMISFSGILTFKNAGDLRAVARGIPEDRLLIETDSPYLAPEPLRGQPNEPANVRRVAETLAEIRSMSLETIAAATTRNATRLFWRSETENGATRSTQPDRKPS